MSDGATCIQVFGLLDEIKNKPGKLDKAALLESFCSGPLGKAFQSVLRAGLDPYITYGIAKMPKWKPCVANTVPLYVDTLLELCGMLQTRELTGNAAVEGVRALGQDHDHETRSLIQMVVTKNFRCGFSVSTVNKVFKKIGVEEIPVFECMLAKKYEEKRVTFPTYVEPKLDGVRVLALVLASRKGPENILSYKVEFVSRTGKPFTSFDHIGKVIANAFTEGAVDDGFEPVSYVLDGEMVSGNFNETVSQARRKEQEAQDAVFTVFHMSKLNTFQSGQDRLGYAERRNLMTEFFKSMPDLKDLVIQSPAYLVNSHSEIMSIYAKIRAQDGEGVIVKDRLGKYQNKRSFNWLKIKGEESVDVRVTGKFEGKGKYEGTLGGLIVDVDGVAVRVGGGFSDAQRNEFWRDFETHINGSLIEVEYHEKTPDGSLRHPRFVRFRDDKDSKVV